MARLAERQELIDYQSADIYLKNLTETFLETVLQNRRCDSDLKVIHAGQHLGIVENPNKTADRLSKNLGDAENILSTLAHFHQAIRYQEIRFVFNRGQVGYFATMLSITAINPKELQKLLDLEQSPDMNCEDTTDMQLYVKLPHDIKNNWRLFSTALRSYILERAELHILEHTESTSKNRLTFFRAAEEIKELFYIPITVHLPNSDEEYDLISLLRGKLHPRNKCLYQVPHANHYFSLDTIQPPTSVKCHDTRPGPNDRRFLR